MPAIKHPCPHCGKWVMRDVAACPFCGKADPFAPGRCPSCRAIIEDPAWVACPSCGTNLKEAAATGAPAPTPTATPAPAPAAPAPTAPAPAAPAPTAPAPAAPAETPAPVEPLASGATCSGCGSPLPSGARFCAVCGTLVG